MLRDEGFLPAPFSTQKWCDFTLDNSYSTPSNSNILNYMTYITHQQTRLQHTVIAQNRFRQSPVSSQDPPNIISAIPITNVRKFNRRPPWSIPGSPSKRTTRGYLFRDLHTMSINKTTNKTCCTLLKMTDDFGSWALQKNGAYYRF